jgi:multisubunit Na+/H+ antiporter MnhG subunit
MKTLRILKYVGFGILGVGFVTLTIYLVMCLWNSLIPVLFHGPVLTFWQTAGMFLLSKILLTGIAPGSREHGRKDWRRRYNDKYRHSCREDEKIATPGQA